MRPRVPSSTSFQPFAKDMKLMQDTIFVDIDVSLKSNAVCILNSQGKKLSSFTVHNDQEGSRALASHGCSCMSKVAAEYEIRFGIGVTKHRDNIAFSKRLIFCKIYLVTIIHYLTKFCNA